MRSRTTTFSFFILFAATLPYIHDLIPPDNKEFLGFSNLRVFAFMLLNNLFALIGWLLAYYLAKGKQWRFVLWLPILSTTYEIILKILNLRSTTLNEINVKFILTFCGFALLVAWYFSNRKKNEPMDN